MRLFLLIIILSSTLYPQQDSILTIEDFLELVSDASLIDQDDSQILDVIEDLLLYPVNINEAGLQDILEIPFIDAASAQRIIDYRNQNGNYFSKKELQNIEGFDNELIMILTPLISISNYRSNYLFNSDTNINLSSTKNITSPPSNLKLALRSRIITDLQKRKGFEDDSFRGSKLKSYMRIRTDYNNQYSFAGLIEKDAGEESFTDFYSASLGINDVLFFEQIIIGDYLTEFGQGLVLWSPYAFSKGSQATSTAIRKARTFSNYTSSDENQFFRGIALKSHISSISLSGFFSINEVDASLIDGSNDISSLHLSGFHRTSSELKKKNNLNNTTYGMIVNTNPFDFFNVSLLHTISKFNKFLVPNNQFQLNGNSFAFTSLSYDLILSRLRLTGEFAYNGFSLASVNSLSFELTQTLSAIVLVRNYPMNFTNLYGNGFGESSNTQNEFGIYIGLKWRTSIGNVNVYYDQFKFPFATNNLAMPSIGNELMINYSNHIAKGFNITARYKNELKEIEEEIDNVQQLVDRRRQNMRIDFILNIHRNLRIKSRLEFSDYSVELINIAEQGYMFFQDVRLNLSDDLRFYGRIIFFQTDSYNSRLYEFENDLTGVLTNPALFGEGIKWYLLLNYNLSDYLSFSMKYSEIHKPEELVLGSGLNEISNNIDNRISIQIDYRL